MMLKTNIEEKQYILRVWNVSSGARITKMLKKYWGLEEPKDIIQTAKKLFT